MIFSNKLELFWANTLSYNYSTKTWQANEQFIYLFSNVYARNSRKLIFLLDFRYLVL